MLAGGKLCEKKARSFRWMYFFYHIIERLPDFKLRNKIIWYFEHGLHTCSCFSGRYKTILWFTKDDWYVFNLDDVRVLQKYPRKQHYRGPKKGLTSSNPLSKNLGDIWNILERDWDNLLWDIPNIKSNHPEKTIHPAQFPVELAERLILALSNEDGIMRDPFIGIGTTAIAVILHQRRGIGVNKEQPYISIALQHIKQAINGTLKRKPMTKCKYIPTNKEKIIQKSIE